MQGDHRQQGPGDGLVSILAAADAGEDRRRRQGQQPHHRDPAQRIMAHRGVDPAGEQPPDVTGHPRRPDQVGEPRMLSADEPPDQPEGDQHRRRPARRDVPGGQRAVLLRRQERQGDRGHEQPVEQADAQVPGLDGSDRGCRVGRHRGSPLKTDILGDEADGDLTNGVRGGAGSLIATIICRLIATGEGDYVLCKRTTLGSVSTL